MVVYVCRYGLAIIAYSIQMQQQSAVKKQSLALQVLTWEKDSHGLYDYETSKHTKEHFQIQGPCKMFRNWYNAQSVFVSIDKVKRGQLPDEAFSFVSSILHRHNGNVDSFLMSVPQRPSQELIRKENREGGADDVGAINTNAYIVVKHYKLSRTGYPLSLGNIVKLGRVEYKVVQIGGRCRADKKQDGGFLGQFDGVHRAQGVINGTCKFCLCDENTDDNFLISPCKCSGSCETVHTLCLKMWIDSKVKKQVNGVVVSYNFTKFQCQICQQPFPRMVTRDKFQLQMITIEKPSKPYIIFEGINDRRESREERCLHVISPEEGNSIKIGRGHQCEIRLQDISVSRTHSEIKYTQGEFLINDSDSKFGTLVKLDKPIELNSKIKLQIGRSLLQFSMQ